MHVRLSLRRQLETNFDTFNGSTNHAAGWDQEREDSGLVGWLGAAAAKVPDTPQGLSLLSLRITLGTLGGVCVLLGVVLGIVQLFFDLEELSQVLVWCVIRRIPPPMDGCGQSGDRRNHCHDMDGKLPREHGAEIAEQNDEHDPQKTRN